MKDLIERRAAIEAIEKHIRTAEEPYQLTDADKVMNHAFEIAASCVYNLSATEADVPDINDGDMISRQAAIDAFLTELTKRERKNLLHTWSTVEVEYFVVDMLEKSPSAQSETAERTTETAQNVSDSDLISRKAVIDELRTCYDTDRKDFTNGDEYINYEQAVCLIERLPSAHPEHRWIPVTVRLPKDYEDVLVWYEYFKYGEYNRMVQTCDVGYYISEFNRWGGVTGQKVRAIAWMPLPEPYKEVE